MNEFWTAGERAFRSRAAAYFHDLADPVPGQATWPFEKTGPGAAGLPPEGLSGGVSILDEAARRDPNLARELLARLVGSTALDPPRRLACELGRLAGTAAHVFAEGTSAARSQGYFSSILMDFRVAQERLAGLVAGAELARLGACRICRLLERGDPAAAEREAAVLSARAKALDAEIRSAAESLLGRDWVEARLPAGGPSSGEERTSS